MGTVRADDEGSQNNKKQYERKISKRKKNENGPCKAKKHQNRHRVKSQGAMYHYAIKYYKKTQSE